MNKGFTDKLAEAMTKLRVYCKCGHSVTMPMCVERQLCSWCGNYVFRNKHIEFLYRFNQQQIKNRR